VTKKNELSPRRWGRPIADRFWEKVQRAEGDGCWLWNAGKDSKGYGVFHRCSNLGHRTIVAAHRMSWELVNGPVPEGLGVLHDCDTPACVRPDHLFLGTQLANIKDRDEKGRTAKGERNSHARLTKENVAQIRANFANGAKRKELAIEFGVCRSTINQILRYAIWR
jgi:hypothetical protein